MTNNQYTIQEIYSLYENKQFTKAVEKALKIYKKNKHNHVFLNLLGALYKELGQYENAIKYFQKSLKLDGNDFSIYNNLGLVYFETLDFQKAKEMFLKALTLNQNHHSIYLNLGNVALEEQKFDEAKILLEKALSLGESSYKVYHSLAKLHFARSNFNDSLAMFQKAISINSTQPDVLFEFSLLLLKLKEYKSGFEIYKYRYNDYKKDQQTFLLSKNNLLKKGIDINGKKILLTYEQGYGDVLQFSRFIPMFEDQGAKVYVSVKKLLLTLLKKSYPNTIFLEENNNIDYDYHMPIMDAASFFGLEYNNVPFSERYISVDQKDKREVFEKYFQNENKKKIGIVWRSNASGTESYSKQKERESRNCTLEEFLTYFNANNIKLYSLQVNVNENEKKILKDNNIQSLGDNLGDFYDNALIISNLDFFIGIDTISTLIAGSLGIKSIVLLSNNSDWRWGIEDVTPWFESISIVRKQEKTWDNALKKAFSLQRVLCNINPIEKMMEQGIIYHQQGNLVAAEQQYRAVLQEDSSHSNAYHLLGLIAYQTGHTEQAIAMMKQALILDPMNDEAYKNLQNISSTIKESKFINDYLNFTIKNFTIQQFSHLSSEPILSTKEKKIVKTVKNSVKNTQLDIAAESTIELYLNILETNINEGFKSFLQIDSNMLSEEEKLKILYYITQVQGFKLKDSNFAIIQSFFANIFTIKNFEQLTLDNQVKIIKVFCKYYSSNSTIFENIFKHYIVPILRQYMEYNKIFSELRFGNNSEDFNKWFQITHICNIALMDRACLPFLKNELKELFELATLYQENKFDKLDYSQQNLFMDWYTSLRDTIDDSFLNEEYALFINDTSYHYHPGCFMTSYGIKQSLQKEYRTIIDIPIHEIYSYGQEFLQLNSTNFDSQEIYQLFKINFPIIHKKLLYAKEIIINGEGTIHNLYNHVLFLLYLAYISKKIYAKKVSIINHSPYPSYSLQNRNSAADILYKKVYDTLDFTGIREEYSKSIMDKINVKSSLTFDCSSIYLNSLNQSKLKNSTNYKKYIVISSSVVANNNIVEAFKNLISMLILKKYNIVLLNGGPQEEKSFLQDVYKDFRKDERISFVEAKSVDNFLSIIKHATMLISGRFHYSIIAMYLKCPFILLSSNTHKNLGLIKMADLPNQVIDFQDKGFQEKIQIEFDNILHRREAYIVSDKHLDALCNLANSNFTYATENNTTHLKSSL